ncbi:MAG: class I SAM-dependent methyltransferase [Prolixibacteraceae bacterium]|nr:class I SAM-dependent methyltransferase [Prolixibacteraceae bacterium]
MIDRYTKTLSKINGIWSADQTDKISYPENGNMNMFLLEDQSYWFNYRNQIIGEVAQKFIPQGIIFDVGGGNGFVSKMLKDNGYTPVLVEPGKEGILNARERGIEHLIHSRFDDAGFKENSIDNAGFFDVIEHIEDDHLFLKNLSQAMKTNGKVILTAPSFHFLWSKADTEAGHYRRYTMKQMKKLLEDSGFRILYANYFFSFLLAPIFLFRTLPSLFCKRKQRILKSNETEHSPTSKIVKKIISFLCDSEIRRIKRGRKLFGGSSCIVVAEKVPEY